MTFIEGVDDIPPRNILDHNSNGHGTLFGDFLLRSNMCVLNGRSDNDDFTCVSTKGASVVDYCIIPQEAMLLQWNFSVTRAREVFNQAGCDKVADNIIPDHSLLFWDLPCGDTLTNRDNNEGGSIV